MRNRICLKYKGICGFTIFTFFVILILLYYLDNSVYTVPSNAFVVEQPFAKDDVPWQRSSSLQYRLGELYLHSRHYRIVSAIIDYYRLPRSQWRRILLGAKFAGLNTIEISIPWSLHEPIRYNDDFSGNLDVSSFLSIAGSVGLRVIVNPGPFVGNGLDFGGLPAWLLSDPEMRVLSLYGGFASAAVAHLRSVISRIRQHQASVSPDSPIVAFKLDAAFGDRGDAEFLHFLLRAIREAGANELVFVAGRFADYGESRRLLSDAGCLPAVVDVGDNVESFRRLSLPSTRRPDLPEFAILRCGRDGDNEEKKEEKERRRRLLRLVERLSIGRGAGVSLGRWHPAAGAGLAEADGADYEGDAECGFFVDEAGEPVSGRFGQEMGRLLGGGAADAADAAAAAADAAATSGGARANDGGYYGKASVVSSLQWRHFSQLITSWRRTTSPLFMEEVGQNYGFLLYKCTFKSAQTLTVQGRVLDWGLALVNSAVVGPPLDGVGDVGGGSVTHVSLADPEVELNAKSNILELLVENVGRSGWSSRHDNRLLNRQRRGVSSLLPGNAEIAQNPGRLLLNGRPVAALQVASLEFDPAFLANALIANNWLPLSSPGNQTASATATLKPPALYRLRLTETADAHADAGIFLQIGDEWGRGVAFVNGVCLGRYGGVGRGRRRRRRMRVPASAMRERENELIIFELLHAGTSVDIFANSGQR